MTNDGTISRVAARFGVAALLACAWPLTAAHAQPSPPPTAEAVRTALRRSTAPLTDTLRVWEALGTATRRARVIALGEATHGQHEVFDLKRRLTMALIREHGVRVVAYEASAAAARKADAWVQGGGGTVTEAMDGFGMLIWQVDENVALLRDLRAWNATAPRTQRVRFIGVDAQDGDEVVGRLRALLLPAHPAESAAVDSVMARAAEAVRELRYGRGALFDTLRARLQTLDQRLQRLASTHPSGEELRLRSTELRGHVLLWETPGARDRVMAELLLAQLRPGDRAVLLAHNAHVARGPLSFGNSTEPAMGGHLARALGAQYYAMGVAFGAGGFQANATDSAGRWIFRHYQQGAPPAGFFEETLLGATDAGFFLDARALRAESPLGRWLREPQRMRWWGGYQIPEHPDDQYRDPRNVPTFIPARDYDGLLFVSRTTPAMPVDRGRLRR